MKYSRLIKNYTTGADVTYVQQKLLQLGYSLGKYGADGKYGDTSEKVVKSFQKDNGLSADGIVGPKTWDKLEEKTSGVQFTRNLKKGMSGTDVRYMKDCLYELKYLTAKPTHNTFGGDTYNAVMSFQRKNNDSDGKVLTIGGIIGRKTWDAVVKAFKSGNSNTPDKPSKVEYITAEEYPNLHSRNITAINNALSNTTNERIKVVKEVLKYAYDHDKGGNCVALYVFGENLYNTDLTLNVMTASKIEKAAKKYPSYFNGGRKEWMLEQVKKNPNMAGSDCSGMEVGYMRKFGMVKSGFDTTANNFCSDSYSVAVSKSSLKPGDWVGKSGHIGTYVGGGLVVEFAGGAYGCQLTDLDDRKCYNFVTKKLERLSGWTKYRDPKAY